MIFRNKLAVDKFMTDPSWSASAICSIELKINTFFVSFDLLLRIFKSFISFQVARKQRDCLQDAVKLEPLLQFSYPADMPEAPPHIHKRVMIEPEVIDDSDITAKTLKEVFGLQEDDSEKIISSLRRVSLSFFDFLLND